MTYDPVNDRHGGNILGVKKVPVEPGSAGVQVQVKCDLLLEGFRPKRSAVLSRRLEGGGAASGGAVERAGVTE